MDAPNPAPRLSKPRRTTHSSGGRPASGGSDELSGKIASLNEKDIEALRKLWVGNFRGSAPPIQSPDTLRRLIAWKLQAEAFGDLDAETIKLLKRAQTRLKAGKSLGTRAGPQLRTGMILVREWRGNMHRVLVLDDGFEHDDERYRTLSEVARKISGTRWSGPRFFGLESKSDTIEQNDPIAGGLAP